MQPLLFLFPSSPSYRNLSRATYPPHPHPPPPPYILRMPHTNKGKRHHCLLDSTACSTPVGRATAGTRLPPVSPGTVGSTRSCARSTPGFGRRSATRAALSAWWMPRRRGRSRARRRGRSRARAARMARRARRMDRARMVRRPRRMDRAMMSRWVQRARTARRAEWAGMAMRAEWVSMVRRAERSRGWAGPRRRRGGSSPGGGGIS